jgi:glycosyltransferase involved in cell wall biosynthesis
MRYQYHIACAIDLDTIAPVLLATRWRKKKRVYDAHELFTEMKEVITRPIIHKCWLAIERWAVPHFPQGYTVNAFIANELHRRHGVQYSIIRNLPVKKELRLTANENAATTPFLLYQGAVNEGRSFETLIPAMQQINIPLWICGDGNFMQQVKALVATHQVADKVIFKGMVTPQALAAITPKATIGLTLFEATGLNQYYSLANRFFDYMMAGIPQICVNYPEYAAINKQYEIAVLINDTQPATIATAVNKLLTDAVRYKRLQEQCKLAANDLHWQAEANKLIQFYENL